MPVNDSDSATHPVLCCVGDSVAGQATQFLMEKAIVGAHLDWRVISVEVQPENLEIAVAGMKAMSFAALRFFSPLAQRAAQLICPESLECQFVGSITSAKKDALGWTCWHHAGAAIQACASSSCDWSSAVVWLHGNSENLRSVVLNCRESPPRTIIWTAGPGNVPADAIEQQRLHCVAQDSGDDLVTLLSQQLNASTESSTLILLGELSEIRQQTIASLEVPQHCQLVAAVPGSGVRRKLKSNWRGAELTVLSDIDLAVTQEAIDFQRWTGREADKSLLQDAYEEYIDF